MSKYDFSRWIQLGDEWILSYLQGPPITTFGSVVLFSLAHAFEQYFKACLVYKDLSKMPDGHDTFKFYKQLKSDPAFLPDLNIEQDVYDKYSVETGSKSTLDIETQKKILHYQDILLPFKYNADLKYFDFKKAKGPKSYGWAYPNDNYAGIFSHIRSYVKFDSKRNADFLQMALDENVFFGSKKEFLKICVS